MMVSMATLIAPVVLGITIALQKIIMDALKQLSKSGMGNSFSNSGVVIPSSIPGANMLSSGMFGGQKMQAALAHAATQGQLFFVVGFYMIEIILVLIYFASRVNEGKNDLALRMTLARTLPMGMTIFIAVAFGAMKMTAIGL